MVQINNAEHVHAALHYRPPAHTDTVHRTNARSTELDDVPNSLASYRPYIARGLV